MAKMTKEEVIKHGKLNEVIVTTKLRKNGTRRIQQDFEYCPTMAEQHTAHLSDINYLMQKYKPDELAAYIAARSQYRQEIMGHDFASEPNLQEAKNIVLESRKAFEALPQEITSQFQSHLEFLKFVDNPANAEKLIKLGLATKRQLENVQIKETDANLASTRTPTQEKDANDAKK